MHWNGLDMTCHLKVLIRCVNVSLAGKLGQGKKLDTNFFPFYYIYYINLLHTLTNVPTWYSLPILALVLFSRFSFSFCWTTWCSHENCITGNPSSAAQTMLTWSPSVSLRIGLRWRLSLPPLWPRTTFHERWVSTPTFRGTVCFTKMISK